MNAGVKKKWVAALRSGDYRQGRKRLRTQDNYYCCLGVLCCVLGQGEWVKAPYSDDWGYKEEDGLYPKEFCLPDAFARDLELLGPKQVRLINLNDDKKASFSDIADHIEAEL